MSLIRIALLSLYLVGCGIRGDLVPPSKPSDIGRGRPTYKRATENLHPNKPFAGSEEEEKTNESEAEGDGDGE